MLVRFKMDNKLQQLGKLLFVRYVMFLVFVTGHIICVHFIILFFLKNITGMDVA